MGNLTRTQSNQCEMNKRHGEILDWNVVAGASRMGDSSTFSSISIQVPVPC